MILDKLNEIHHLMEEQITVRKKILTLDEASKFLGISKSDLYKRTSSKSIPFFKPSGKLIYFLREDLENWMMSNRQESINELNERISNFKINVK